MNGLAAYQFDEVYNNFLYVAYGCLEYLSPPGPPPSIASPNSNRYRINFAAWLTPHQAFFSEGTATAILDGAILFEPSRSSATARLRRVTVAKISGMAKRGTPDRICGSSIDVLGQDGKREGKIVRWMALDTVLSLSEIVALPAQSPYVIHNPGLSPFFDLDTSDTTLHTSVPISDKQLS